jgi:hypothetical protein
MTAVPSGFQRPATRDLQVQNKSLFLKEKVFVYPKRKTDLRYIRDLGTSCRRRFFILYTSKIPKIHRSSTNPHLLENLCFSEVSQIYDLKDLDVGHIMNFMIFFDKNFLVEYLPPSMSEANKNLILQIQTIDKKF